MEAFAWTPCFVTGLDEVDAQHHRLVDLINRFGSLLLESGASATELESVFVELADYARYHFSEEESMMSAQGLDPRYIEEHRKSHERFLSEVTRLHESVAAGDPDSARSLLQFLTHWLSYHILGSDQFMARQIAAIQAGTPASQAFQAQSSGADPAMATLLNALNGLFHLVSQRNEALVQLNQTLEERVAQRTEALSDANQRLYDIANTDVLTGLPNRRHAMRSLALAWDESLRDGRPLACLMIDADGFKRINDTHGHDAGDAVLCALSNCLRDVVRTDDTVCRLGGDEFLVICAGTPLEGAMQLAETVRAEVAALRVRAGSGEWRGSVSVGVAARTPEMVGVEQLMKAADLGVYAAKEGGRNRVASVQRAG